MIHLRHQLAVLAALMPWPEIASQLAHQLAGRARVGKNIAGEDFFGPFSQFVSTRASGAGRPRLSRRLLSTLLYLKHAFIEGDERVVKRWGETPIWQYFSEFDYFEHCSPCDPTTLIKFRKAIGAAPVDEFLAQTINVALYLNLIAVNSLESVIVDTTVQPKAIAYPTGSRLLEVAFGKRVESPTSTRLRSSKLFPRRAKRCAFRPVATRTPGSSSYSTAIWSWARGRLAAAHSTAMRWPNRSNRRRF